MTDTVGLAAYRMAAHAAGPALRLTLRRRLAAGKEDPARLPERRGVPGAARPEGRLVWLHGASVGESLSVLPLIEALSEREPGARFLVTTGTVTSAALMAERLPPRAIHQYAPLDQPGYVARFLSHWRPDAGLFVESELWPCLIREARRRGVPLALVNGRISPRSFARWRKRPKAARALLDGFDVLLAQDPANAERLETLAGRAVPTTGNLKHAAPALPVDARALHLLTEAVMGRPAWLAASTHAGEEEDVLAAHAQVAERLPGTLTIIAPRHPSRGDAVAEMLEAAGLPYARRAAGALPGPGDAVYLADTLGELGLFYRLSDVTFVGGSLSGTGGHNPLEPARLGCAIVTGPDLFNFADIYGRMRAAGGAAIVRNARDLAASLLRLLSDPMTRDEMAARAQGWSDEAAAAVLSDVLDALAPVLSADAHR